MKIVLLTALGVGGATVFGSLLGFIFKKISHKFSDIVLSFAAGVMLCAAVTGLIMPSLEYESGAPLLITVAGVLCGAVFLNILDNACKYGKSGRKIDVNIAMHSETVSVEVRDYGPGIPPDELPYVKKKFYKGSSKERGSGIGLAVCDEIIHLHNGTFDIANAEGGGTVVTIRLPEKERFKPNVKYSLFVFFFNGIYLFIFHATPPDLLFCFRSKEYYCLKVL